MHYLGSLSRFYADAWAFGVVLNLHVIIDIGLSIGLVVQLLIIYMLIKIEFK